MNDGSVSSDLYHFFAAYFHQDWDLFGEDWQEVLGTYVRDETPSAASLQAMAQELETICRSRTEPELEKLVSYTIGVDYNPTPRTYNHWLGQVAERLRQHANAIESETTL